MGIAGVEPRHSASLLQLGGGRQRKEGWRRSPPTGEHDTLGPEASAFNPRAVVNACPLAGEETTPGEGAPSATPAQAPDQGGDKS
jgi:hypothetical protein